ncbi:MAG TPA: type 1 glutamine amidotransferase [Bryobacteraceae bacterium]|nr:type 1 glutamine amidotransferase [Bryobacteraceae bacterium]
MRIACLQHVPFEGPGNIEMWAAERGHPLRIVRLCEGESLPHIDSFDLLVVMGGPMSVHDEAEFPWLRPEKALVAECLKRKKFVLGVCLGSQLLAEVLGTQVYRNRVKEIGWFPIEVHAQSGSYCLSGLPATLDVLHWHGETYNLPPGCIHLAKSEGCAVQAFEHPSAVGLQFHLEATQDGLAALISQCGNEISGGPYEQPAESILSGEKTHASAAKSALYTVLDNVSHRVASLLQ